MKQVTIATYNIRHGHDVNFDWNQLAENIAQSGADIIGIQEVDMFTNRVGGRDTVSGLVQATGLAHALFVPAMDFNGGQYGTAIISRYPIRSFETHELYRGTFEPRSYGIVTVTTEDGATMIFSNTHLSFESSEIRSVQIKQIAEYLETQVPADIPVVLTGDFNTEDLKDFTPLKDMGFSLINDELHGYMTFRNPPAAIDHIFYRESLLKPVEQGMIDSNRSDHNLLWARFEIL